jgi:very-short-patch-repair endonuclease
VAGYVADFCCPGIKLIVELDGGQHYTPEGLEADQRRSAALQALGYEVARFSNVEVLTNTDGVLDAILRIGIDRMGNGCGKALEDG